MRIYKVKVNGKTFEVKILSVSETEPLAVETVKATPAAKTAAPTTPAPAASTAPVSGKPVESPMQGTILDVKVKVGDEVKAGDTLLILEAMKLENEIKAPSNGKVLEIRVQKGATVNSKDVLVVLG